MNDVIQRYTAELLFHVTFTHSTLEQARQDYPDLFENVNTVEDLNDPVAGAVYITVRLHAHGAIDTWRDLDRMKAIQALKDGGLWLHHPSAAMYQDFWAWLFAELDISSQPAKSRFQDLYQVAYPMILALGRDPELVDVGRILEILPFAKEFWGRKERRGSNPQNQGRAQQLRDLVAHEMEEEGEKVSPERVNRRALEKLMQIAEQSDTRQQIREAIRGDFIPLAAFGADVNQVQTVDQDGKPAPRWDVILRNLDASALDAVKKRLGGLASFQGEGCY